MKDINKKTSGDYAHSIVKAAAGSIPIVGAAASELLNLLVTPPLEKRRNQWMEDIGNRLKLFEKEKNFKLESLRDNEIFIDVVLQTTQMALRTSEKEKIEYFKNVLINSAISESADISEIQIFLKLIEDFTTWHVKILKLFDNPRDWFRKNEKEVPNVMLAGLSTILETAYPELKGKNEFYNLIWNDLSNAGLHKTGSLGGMMSIEGLLANRTTEFGKRLLNFIDEKE